MMKRYGWLIFLFAIFPVLAQSSPLELIALDALTVEGSSTFLEAKVFTRGSNYNDPGVSGKKVVFKIGDKILGTAITNEGGMARLSVPAGTGVRNFEASLSSSASSSLRSRGTLYALNPNKPILITDVDGTIAKTPKVDLTTIDNGKIAPIEGSKAMLSALSNKYQVVYISGRYDRTMTLTRDWVNTKGYPRGPVLLAPGLESGHGGVGDFKTTAIGRITKVFKKVPFAVGDRAFDMQAYVRNGVKPVLVGTDPRGEVPRGTVKLGSWSELPVDRILTSERPFSSSLKIRSAAERTARTLGNEGRALGEHLNNSLKEVPQNIKFALMVTFLSKLAKSLDEGNSASIEQFFEEITDIGFYKAFGLFYAGEVASGFVYNRYLEKFVKPKVVKNLLRSNVQFSVAMALPLLASGNFNGKTFVIDMAVFRLSMGAVELSLKGLEAALNLKRLKNFTRLGSALSKLGRFSPAAGWVYNVAKVTLVIYVTEKALPWVHEKLEKHEVKKEVADNAMEMFRVLSDPTASKEAKAEALKKSSESYQAYRNYLIKELTIESNNLMKEVDRVGKKIKGYEMALEKYEEIRKTDPEKYKNLTPIVEKLEREFKNAYERETEEIFNRYFDKKEDIWKGAYEAPKTNKPYVTNDMSSVWAASGANENGLGDPYGGRGDVFADLGRYWVKRSFEGSLRDLPENRLEAYRAEEELYKLALASVSDSATRKLISDELEKTKKMETLDREIYKTLSSGSSAEGFLEKLKRSSQ